MSELVLLTGVSGAGKSTAIFFFEELGYQCIENHPVELMSNLLQLVQSNPKYGKTLVALPIAEAREAMETIKLFPTLKVIKVALTASIKELLSRFKLTRHIHPLQTKGLTLEQAIDLDRSYLEEIQNVIDVYIDTTGLSVLNFRERLLRFFQKKSKLGTMVSIVSFGFKYGLPSDADLVLDARMLPNPFWDETIKHLTGQDKVIVEYVLESTQGQDWLKQTIPYVDYVLHKAAEESRPNYVVAIGCSGGQHRSVALAEYFQNHCQNNNRFETLLVHRDLSKKGQ
jgi:RNase adapter protein RapZ